MLKFSVLGDRKLLRLTEEIILVYSTSLASGGNYGLINLKDKKIWSLGFHAGWIATNFEQINFLGSIEGKF